MARFEIAEFDIGGRAGAGDRRTCSIELGIDYSVGDTVPTDLVAAHKWFNLAALKGCKEAIQLRQEIAAEHVADAEIAAAQRAARDWLTAIRTAGKACAARAAVGDEAWLSFACHAVRRSAYPIRQETWPSG